MFFQLDIVSMDSQCDGSVTKGLDLKGFGLRGTKFAPYDNCAIECNCCISVMPFCNRNRV